MPVNGAQRKGLQGGPLTARVYIGIGSNLGEREANLAEAVKRMAADPSIKVLKESSVNETEPVDFQAQPDFLNQVVLMETACTPEELLEKLKSIESDMGRTETFSKGPRIIDLDILLYGKTVIDSDSLKIPHQGIFGRDFIYEHLMEIDPDIIEPLSGQKLKEVFPKWRRLQS